jgi:hypothetical protein
MSMFGMVFPDPQRQDRFALLFSLVAYNEPDEVAAEAYMQPVMALRLRDCWVEKQPDGPPCLAVYTRNGGGNREHDHTDGAENCLGCRGDWATEHPAYISDEDDEFDSTYRTYRFAFPAELRQDWKEALTEVAEDPRDMSKQWSIAIDAIGGEAASRG